jgi:hypothetical protein
MSSSNPDFGLVTIIAPSPITHYVKVSPISTVTSGIIEEKEEDLASRASENARPERMS